MKNIVIAGFGQPILNLIKTLKNKFVIRGIVLDYDRPKKFPGFYKQLDNLSIPIYSLKNINEKDIDAIVVMNYNKMIDIDLIDCPFILNIHMGLLPLYRGNNANAWSILNDDRNVGYTLHQVSEELDGGLIYYKFEYYIKENETYFHAKTAINNDIDKNLPSVIEKVLNKKITGICQEDDEFIYACKLLPEDGILENWNHTTNDILNRKIIFSKPLGSGLKFKFKNQLLEINKISRVKKYKISKGIPGAVVLKTNVGSVWVKTKDSVISIDEIVFENKIERPANLLKIGDRL